MHICIFDLKGVKCFGKKNGPVGFIERPLSFCLKIDNAFRALQDHLRLLASNTRHPDTIVERVVQMS